jgi:hypothetical protein
VDDGPTLPGSKWKVMDGVFAVRYIPQGIPDEKYRKFPLFPICNRKAKSLDF